MKKIERSSKLFGISFFGSSSKQLLSELTNHTSHGSELKTVVTPNPEQIVLSRSNPTFLDHIRAADYRLPDGVGVVRASQLLSLRLGQPIIKERITGVDIASRLLIWAAHTSKVVLVIGGRGYDHQERQVPQEYNQLGLHRLGLTIHQLLSDEEDREPQVSAVNVLPTELEHWYWHEGFQYAAHPTNQEEQQLEKAIQLLQPDIVFVALGAPYQEKWLMEHRDLFKAADTQIGMVVGGAFDLLLGKIKRAPSWMRQLGLEWLFRLIQEPWRWKRQLRFFPYARLVIQEAIGRNS